MTSKRKIEANRRNAQKSTGPRTPEGKAASRFNALKHGLTAPQALLPTEDPADFDDLLQAFERDLQPADDVETAFVHQAASAWWRLRRARRYETDYITSRMAVLEASEGFEDYHRADPASRPSYIVTQVGGSLQTVMSLSLLETRLERLFYKSLHEIERRQSRRPSEFDPPPTGDYQLDFGPGSDPRPHPPRPRPEDPDNTHHPPPAPKAPSPTMSLMISLITLDPGHFHAALIQKEMYPDVSPRVHVYAPVGKDLVDHLQRVTRFNLRTENPTAWELEVHAGPDFLERMVRERAGNVVVLSGRNRGKIDRILASLGAGLHVLADKPWIIEPADLPKLQAALDAAEAQSLVAYDIMTERYEITSLLQRELVQDREIFGTPVTGSQEEPAVFLESVHHLSKTVAGATLQRPVWFFDIRQQGEGLTDVGTHLVDLVPWTLFPGEAIDYRTEIQVLTGRRWPTMLSAANLQRITGEPAAEALDYYCNTAISYVLRGLHVKLNVLWNLEAPPGGGDTHLAVYRGTRSRVEVRQGPEEGYRPELFVVRNAPVEGQHPSPHPPDPAEAVRRRVAMLQARFPGLDVEQEGERSRITIPDRYRVGHEAHFAQVAAQFFEYLKNPADLPAWEKANQLAKYYVTTQGVEMARGS